MSWRQQAACVDQPHIFFPDEEPGDQKGRINRARQICASCPVQDPCLQYALTLNPAEDYGGIWAGTTQTQRVWLRRTGRDTAFHRGQCAHCGTHYVRIRNQGPTPKYCTKQCQRQAKYKGRTR